MILHSGYTGELASGETDIGDNIPYSLLLDSGLIQYFNRTPSVVGNRKTWKFRILRKWGKLSVEDTMLSAGTSAGDCFIFYRASDNTLRCYYNGAVILQTVPVERDPIGHLDIALDVDMTQSTASERMKPSVNGVYITAFTTYAPPAQNTALQVNNTVLHCLGYQSAPVGLPSSEGYWALPMLVDGAVPANTAFGRISADTQQWVNKTYTGTYGTNGFKLEFANPSALGTDTSGNGNNWTTNGGITSANQYADTPTNNYCALNPLDKINYANGELSTGNTKLSVASGYNGGIRGTLAVTSGKFWMEWLIGASSGNWTMVGFYDANLPLIAAASTDATTRCWLYASSNGSKYVAGVSAAYGATFTTGDVIGACLDATNGTIEFFKQTGGVGSFSSQGVAFTGLAGKNLTPFFCDGAANAVATLNCGQRAFNNSSLPTGAKALCTANLLTPAIPDPTKHIYVATVAKSGNTSFTLPWSATDYDTLFEGKIRNAAGSNFQIDGLRGYDKVLHSDTTAAEVTDANYLSVSGNTVTLKGSLPDGSYVITCKKAGLVSARQTNTNGSITSTVSANQLSGFSIAIWTGNGVNGATVGHGLSSTPELIVGKNRTNADTNWPVYHKSLSAGNMLLLNAPNQQSAISGYNGGGISTAVTSTVFASANGTVNLDQINKSGSLYVAYCHHSVEGYSKFGSYVGNGSADGTFVSCGFKPISTVVKVISSTGNWAAHDAAREQTNPQINYLAINSSAAEVINASLPIDYVATGIKLRDSIGGFNAVQSYIYAAYGYPTKYATAR